MVIFSSHTRLLGDHLPKITDSGLYFAINRSETHFLCDFMMKWLSVKPAGRAKIWGSHQHFRYWTSFFSDQRPSKPNISLNFPFPGSILLENDQKFIFYVAEVPKKTQNHHFEQFFCLLRSKNQKYEKIDPKIASFTLFSVQNNLPS